MMMLVGLCIHGCRTEGMVCENDHRCHKTDNIILFFTEIPDRVADKNKKQDSDQTFKENIISGRIADADNGILIKVFIDQIHGKKTGHQALEKQYQVLCKQTGRMKPSDHMDK